MQVKDLQPVCQDQTEIRGDKRNSGQPWFVGVSRSKQEWWRWIFGSTDPSPSSEQPLIKPNKLQHPLSHEKGKAAPRTEILAGGGGQGGGKAVQKAGRELSVAVVLMSLCPG